MRIDRLDNDDMAPIYLRIRLNKEKAKVSTSVKVTPESWDAHKECVIKHPDAVSYNNALNALIPSICMFSGASRRKVLVMAMLVTFKYITCPSQIHAALESLTL